MAYEWDIYCIGHEINVDIKVLPRDQHLVRRWYRCNQPHRSGLCSLGGRRRLRPPR